MTTTPDAAPATPPAAVDEGHALFAERYRAMSSRDTRFDGQFITGVHSTGIYCRPSCPATTPKASNVTFYRTAAAAHEAGLRACKRCQPDAVPGSPEWNRYDDLASRAMRLIADGTVERDGVPGLASRLGYTPRHLTRVLVTELGAGPLALARAHRAQTARILLTATDLPISDVAFAAGFASVRQFNETIAAVYERTPSELRRAGSRPSDGSSGSPTSPRRTGSASLQMTGSPSPPMTGSTGVDVAARESERDLDSGAGTGSGSGTGAGAGTGTGTGTGTETTVTLRLPARAPFDGAGLMRFYADHAILGVETGDATTYARSVRLPRGSAHLEVALDTSATPGARPTGIVCTARLDDVADLSTLVTRVRRLFDLDADSAAIDEALASDPVLAPSIAAHPGVRLPGALDIEEALFRTLLGQQVSVPAARTVLGRVCAELAGDGTFPTAAQFAERGHEVLRGPASRVRSIIGVAEALASGDLVLDLGMPVDELMADLVALKGVGPWTAGYVAMRALGSPDILLSTDLIMLQSAASLGIPSTMKGLAEYGRRWAPWRSYAGLHLWRSVNR